MNALDRDGRLRVWTDGSFHTASTVGGWAHATYHGHHLSSGALGDGVSSEYMELYAVSRALDYHATAHPTVPLLVLSDHAGLVHKLNLASTSPRDFASWARSRAQRASRISGDELGVLLVALSLQLDPDHANVCFRWTRGHDTDPTNKVVDRASRRARYDYEAATDRVPAFYTRPLRAAAASTSASGAR